MFANVPRLCVVAWNNNLNKYKMKTPKLDEQIMQLNMYDRNNEISENGKEMLNEFIAIKEQLRLYGVVKSLPIQDLPNCTRVEVIDQKGRSYVNWKPTNKIRLSMQDEGRTAKIFIG